MELKLIDFTSLFQFLIGTIKTENVTGSSVTFVTFQFLIGTIKTFLSSNFFTSLSTFQFLIGTIKTPAYYMFFPCILLVSIPYRYYKNGQKVMK